MVELYEQETHINWDEETKEVRVYTSSPTIMKMLDSLYECIEVAKYRNGKICSKTYRTTQECIQFKPDPNFKKKRKKRSSTKINPSELQLSLL